MSKSAPSNETQKNLAVINETQKNLTDPTRLELIKRTLCPSNITHDEFGLFVLLAKKYSLDPFARQIWITKYGKGDKAKAQIFAGRDGFLDIAHRSEHLDGFETSVERIEEPFEIECWDKTTSPWKKKIFKQKFQYKAVCTVYVKGFAHPIKSEVYEEEYSTGQNLWVTKRRTMIGKVAESQALRKAFSISGLYAPEEISDIENEQKTQVPEIPPIKTATQVKVSTAAPAVNGITKPKFEAQTGEVPPAEPQGKPATEPAPTPDEPPEEPQETQEQEQQDQAPPEQSRQEEQPKELSTTKQQKFIYTVGETCFKRLRPKMKKEDIGEGLRAFFLHCFKRPIDSATEITKEEAMKFIDILKYIADSTPIDEKWEKFINTYFPEKADEKH